MKHLVTLATLATALVFGTLGCHRTESGVTIDTSKIESAFADASAAGKAEADKAVSAIKNADYAGALASLKQAASNVRLTPQQQSAIKDTIAQVQTKMEAALKETAEKTKEAAKQAGDAANQAVKDLQKAVK